MAVGSYYKGRPLGKLPPCAICAGPGEGPRAVLHLPHGVRVWLCAGHRDPAFLTKRSGRDLVTSLMRVWSAAGCLTRRRHRALDVHLARLNALRTPTPRPRPGSYAWPELRLEAERRFAAGEPPAAVAACIARPRAGERRPSRRTLRRWFTEGRWLDPGAGPPSRPAGPPAGPTPARRAAPSERGAGITRGPLPTIPRQET